ncbi:MAG TPA: hypothetical protein VGO68_15380 [Pyrinomonadaceae bacterium]|nr:hypothetical protein [Pyrinomonadaceae bacterium]
MFSNLIESSSHAREIKWRGSFVFFTITTYALLFIVAGVISIYAYDARLEEPASKVTMLGPIDIEPVIVYNFVLQEDPRSLDSARVARRLRNKAKGCFAQERGKPPFPTLSCSILCRETQ